MSDNKDAGYWRKKAECYEKELAELKKEATSWRTKTEELEKELEEFRESSQMYEKELESSLEQAEKTIKELRLRNNSLQFENDTIKDKYDELQQGAESRISDFEEEASQFQKREEEYVKYIRELEQKNDDLERAQRATYTSLGEFETKLNSALERNVLLESELDEKELLKAMVQRLKDETRDLKQEIQVREKCKHGDGEKNRIVDSNKLESNDPNAPASAITMPPLKSKLAKKTRSKLTFPLRFIGMTLHKNGNSQKNNKEIEPIGEK